MQSASKGRALLPLLASARPLIEFRPATGVLTPYIESFYLYRSDAEEVGGVDRVDLGQLRFLLKGEGMVTFAHGRREPTAPIMVNAPGTAAATYRMRGPFHCFGLSLRAMGWKTMIGRPADQVADRVIDVIAANCGDGSGLLEELRQLATLDEMVAVAAPRFERLLERSKPVPELHVLFLDVVREWGASPDPKLETLYAAVRARAGVGERQVQRLCKEYFAGPPAHLRRKYRAIAAAVRIYRGASVEDVVGPFSDQSHMINEIRHFTGHTPTTLRVNIDPVLALTLDHERFDFPRVTMPPEVDVADG